MPTAVSLFSGCGGSDAGVIAAGFDVIMANDILPYARDVYLANFPETDYRLGDVCDISDFPAADLLVGCYPCQGFSQGGAREANRKINTLYLEFARALSIIQPRAFIAENVSGLRRSTYRHLLEDQLTKFAEAGAHGYSVYWKQINAHEYGVAQERKRVVIVGIRKDLNAEYKFPAPTHGPNAEQPYFNIAQALEGLPEWPEGEFCEDPFHWYYLSRNRRRDWCEISKTIVSHMRHMPLHPSSPKLHRIHTDKWEFEVDEPARRFSFREAARLQGFMPRYTTHGGDLIFPETVESSQKNIEYNILRQRYKVVGNAVPPPMFEAVASALPNIWA
ncbi:MULTISPECIES: DNA cytosine methyltransferase [Pseudomonas]|uniref:DNA cytosine methyltransferase n=1 Tax=Pseudomonas TaxID=286 RepID=UPI0009A385C9|nr:DNA (cytosine-5-)-methyltransferase [Pseudomonas aeruginosa]EKX8185164.1 DNA (cytosine-5-)-methyltransferase [Pseudomonas aeruginosa]MBQ0240071.1 DNA (cytosine-5-)-methyltransferase [Pseudomonas aeruginosa]MBQ0292622.1 DNA (cytosine-5-)-methyltransferase [Pseudomonas aeruginosa]MBT0637373.1 DNA (cytosine-5-)-methyltransferase [Pseudomonas aeruginosa]MBV7715274.1 DNA cytosine methyltransferase [Pseudomonas aeruginosa]